MLGRKTSIKRKAYQEEVRAETIKLITANKLMAFKFKSKLQRTVGISIDG